MRRFAPVLLLAALAVPTAARPAAAEDERAEWAILVYHDADCDLEAPMLGDLDEMLAAGDTKDVRVVAFVDRSPKAEPAGRYSDRAIGGLEDWSGGKYVEVLKGKLREVSPTPEEPNMGDPATLVAFVERAMTDFPAKHYALVFGDHGMAWPGVCADESNGDDFLTPVELRAALEKITKDHGRLDVVGFDACLMANVETAAGLAPYAKVMVASEELEPGSGWWYTPFLAALEKAPATDAAALAASIAEEYRASFSKQQGVAEPGAGTDITLSVVDLTKAEAVATAAAALGHAAAEALAAHGRAAYLAIAKSRAAAEEYGRSADPKNPGSQMYDLADFAAKLAVAVPSLAPLAAKVEDAVRAAVLDAVRGEARPDSHGLSIYVPRDALGVGGLYDATPLGAADSWAKFLTSYARGRERGQGEARRGRRRRLGRLPRGGEAPDRHRDRGVGGRRGEGLVRARGAARGRRPRRGVRPRGRACGREAVGVVGRRLVHARGREAEDHLSDHLDRRGGRSEADLPRRRPRAGPREGRRALGGRDAHVLPRRGRGREHEGRVPERDEVRGGRADRDPARAGRSDTGRPHADRRRGGGLHGRPGRRRGRSLTVDAESNLKVGFDRVPAGDWLVGFWLEDYSGNSSLVLAPVKVK